MSLILATAVVVALAITPEVDHVSDAGSRSGVTAIAHEFLPRSSALSGAATMPELQAPRYADRPQWAMGGGVGDASEPLQPRGLRALLPPLRSVPPARVAEAGDGSVSAVLADSAGLIAKWRPTIDVIVWCESRGQYGINTGNGFYGAAQWLPSTWASVGGVGRPDLAPPDEQDYRMALMLERGRRGEWPNC